MLTTFNRMLDKPDLGKLLLRFTFGAMMLFHVIYKLLFGINGIIGMVQAHGMPAIVAYGVFLGEIIVPLMFIFGILVRPAALIFAFTMLFAWLITEPGIIFTLTNVGAWGLENIAVYLFAGLAIALLGCGRYSLMRNPAWRLRIGAHKPGATRAWRDQAVRRETGTAAKPNKQRHGVRWAARRVRGKLGPSRFTTARLRSRRNRINDAATRILWRYYRPVNDVSVR